ncbi:hypothetical protein LOK49_LG05G00162 [Camellia lanceoleosa]|uniref:Uncharacterized protein n=1 Tax=Camellia lanceoleosa TaxID=1840588 RepID=A0ACC0HQB0_9ERIC|nr:hypothetical protein LOK49_LG05G00162 [Camellia lanceoleosa]
MMLYAFWNNLEDVKNFLPFRQPSILTFPPLAKGAPGSSSHLTWQSKILPKNLLRVIWDLGYSGYELKCRSSMKTMWGCLSGLSR